jgi:hypothetical protein
MLINLDEVGAASSKDSGGHRLVHFGVYLPNITFNKGYRLQVRIIHEKDQFVRGIEPKVFDLFWHNGSPLDLWDVTVDLTANSDGHFGVEGRYLYRFQLLRGSEIITFWFTDPFGRATGQGTLSAFDIDDNAQPFNWTGEAFRVPEIDEMVVYELHVGEFNGTFAGLIAQLPYLQGLGINVLELMPVSNAKEDVEWGYTPLGYFAPDDRYGGPEEMRRLVRACHEHGIAVIIDAVYAHAHPAFPYNLVYEASDEPKRDGIIAYRRSAEAQGGDSAEDMVVILNFSDQDVDAWIPWPTAGSWRELIDEADSLRLPVQVQQNDEWKPVRVPSHYGAVYLHQQW